MNSTSANLEAMLLHAGWVRQLAAHLVRGPHDADDLVQEVWQATLARGAEPIAEPRAWLAGALRNLGNLRRRGDGRRTRREVEHGERRAVVAPSAADLAAEQELRRDLIARVDRLPAGERDVVLLRFWQDLPPREVARRLGIPVNTVRSRTARALERLRADLDTQHGDRRAWCLMLVPLLDVRALQAAGIGVGGGGLKAAGVVAAVVALAAGYALYADSSTWSPPDFASRAPASDVLARFAVEPTPSAPRREGVPAAAVVDVANPGAAITGRVVDLEGRPIAGAFVHRGTNDWFVAWQKYGKIAAADWSTTTDAEGAFTLPATTFVQQSSSGRLQIGEATHPDFVAELEWTEWALGEAPTIVMRPAYRAELDIEVVEQGSGRPVPRFAATVGATWGRSSSPDPNVIVAPDPQLRHLANGATDENDRVQNGRLRRPIRLVAGAKNRLTVSMAGIDTIEEVLADPVGHGAVVRRRYEVDFDASADVPGHVLARGAVLDAITGQPIAGASLRLVDGAPRGDAPFAAELAATTSREDGSFRLGWAPARQPGRLGVRHPDYEAGDFDGAALANDATLRLVPRGALEVQFVAAGTPQAGLHVLLQCVTAGRDERRQRAITDAEGKVAFERLPPTTVSLYVTPTAMDPDESALDSLRVRVAPGVRTVHRHEFAPPDRVLVAGTVLTGRDVGVRLVPTFVPLDDDRGWVTAKPTGSSGYLAGSLRNGRYLVLLLPHDDAHRAGPFAFGGVVHVRGPVSQGFDFELPHGNVVGRIAGRADTGAGEAMHVVAVLELPQRSLAVEQLLGSVKLAELLGAAVAADGRFELRHVADGACELQLRRGSEVLARRSAMVRGGSLDVGTWDVAGK